jgi:FAD-dependent oxidoreductase domain-containing protein 1
MNSDVLVIGGGVVGLASAYHLKRMNPELSVTLVEQNTRICSGNSGRSAALYRNLFLSRTSRDLAESSIKHYEDIGSDILLKSIGYLWTFGAREWVGIRDQALSLATLARGVTVVEGDELATAAGMDPGPEVAGSGWYPPVAGAILGTVCGSLSAQALANWYAVRFTELGGVLQTGVQIAGFELDTRRTSGGARPPESASLPAPCELPQRILAARTMAGERYQAGSFLLAAGCWLQDLLGPLGIASTIYPKKRQLFAIAAPEPADLFGSGHPGRPAIILPFGGVYIKPVLERGLAVVGRADDLGRPFESSYAGAVASPKAEEEYFRACIEPALRAYFPRLAKRYPEGLELEQAWAGHYDYHWPDKNPVVEQVANIVWVGGSSGSGIMKGDALGRIVAAATIGTDTATLADGRVFRTSDLSLRKRAVDREGLVI